MIAFHSHLLVSLTNMLFDPTPLAVMIPPFFLGLTVLSNTLPSRTAQT